MKWLIFAFALAAIIPCAQWLRQNPEQAPKVWMLFGLLPFGFNPHISPIDWAGWPGYVFGLQVTGLDLLAIIIIITLPRTRHATMFRFAMGLYFIAVVLSIFNAQVPMAAAFYAWQLARVFLIYVVVARACSDERVPNAILTGMAIGLCYQAVLAIWQRFGHGMIQAGGSFGNQNLLGLASEFEFSRPLLLAGKRYGWQTIAAPIAGVIIAVLTTSRATVGLAIIGLVLVFTISSLRGWTRRKATVLFVGVVAIVLLSPVVLYSFEKRFAADPLALEFDERALFMNAASSVLSDHPFGIGANNYVVVANSGGYQERAGVPWGGNQRNTIVHSAYWLTAAETGYLGVVAFVLLMFRTIFTALRSSWNNPKDPRGDLLLGLGVGLLIVALHNFYEWVFVLYDVQYLFAMTVGLVAGISIQLGYRRPAKSRGSQLGFSHLPTSKTKAV